MAEFIAPYTLTQFGTTGNYSAISDLPTLQFTVAHALGFSVFTSRNLATDLSQSHCHFKSFYSIIHFLSLFCSCQIRRRSKTRLFTSDYYSLLARIFLAVSFYNPSARTPREIQSALLTRRVYRAVA
jgi:hypothetical protein